MGPGAVSWYGVHDIGDDRCMRIGTVLQNLRDEGEIFLLGLVWEIKESSGWKRIERDFEKF
jgi:hypothetical protein